MNSDQSIEVILDTIREHASRPKDLVEDVVGDQ